MKRSLRTHRIKTRARRLEAASQPSLTLVTVYVLVFGYVFWLAHMFEVVAMASCTEPVFSGWYGSDGRAWPAFGSMALALFFLFVWNASLARDELRLGGRRRLPALLASFNGVAVLTFAGILWAQADLVNQQKLWQQADLLDWNATRPGGRWGPAQPDPRCVYDALLAGVWKVEKLDRPAASRFPSTTRIEFMRGGWLLAHSGPFAPPYRWSYRGRAGVDGAFEVYAVFSEGPAPVDWWNDYLFWDARIDGDELSLTTVWWAEFSGVELHLLRLDQGESREARIEALHLGVLNWY